MAVEMIGAALVSPGETRQLSCSAPSSQALTIGAQPSAWTTIMRGRFRPIQPIASSGGKKTMGIELA